MRRLLPTLLALTLGATTTGAQSNQSAASPPATIPATPAPPLQASLPTTAPTTIERLRAQLAALRLGGEAIRMPTADSFALGGRTIPANVTVAGPLGVSGGTLEVLGVVDGDAIAIDGNVVVRRGGVITGDALAVGGTVTLDGGRVEGEIRRKDAIGPGAATAAKAPRTTLQAVKLVLGWFAVLVIIGLGVMIFAETNLDGVVAALERGYARSFWYGLLGQLAALPVLAILVLALALTILGILLIPFAVVVYGIAAAGLLTLGFLAAARLTGGAFVRGDGASPRGVHLRALFLGLVLYLGVWLVAAAFTWSPLAGSVLRGIALAVSWVAMTVGLGATLASRAGTQRAMLGAARHAVPADDLSWQTPTPVTGVVAARRGAPVATLRDAP